jgi:hypothetical protein
MMEINMRVCGGLTSYTYMKYHKETSHNYFKWGWEGVKGEELVVVI